METHNKIISVDNLALGEESEESIALCYGHFNLIHTGHLRYLQHAKTLADKLVVAIISDKELDKDSFGSHFSEEERSESATNLQIVDYVIILNELSLDELVCTIKPKMLVLGKEFEQNRSNKINLAISEANKKGCVMFHAGEVHY